MRRKNISPEQKRQVLAQLALGSTPAEVARLAKISTTSVYKIERDAATAALQVQGGQRLETSPLWKVHRDQLMPILLDLRGLGQYALNDDNLIVWYARTDHPWWPISKGHALRYVDGTVSIKLSAEQHPAWGCLKEHLPGHPVWKTLERWKIAGAEDLQARFALLECIIELVESELSLPVIAEMGFAGSDKPAVSLRYAFAIHAQLMAECLGLGHRPYERDAFGTNTFQENPPGNVIYLAGNPAITSEKDAQRKAAIDLFLKAQREWTALPEVQKAGDAYRGCEQAGKEVVGQMDMLDLMLVFPAESRCVSCPQLGLDG